MAKSATLEEVCDRLLQLLGEWNYSASALLSEHESLLRQGLGDHYKGVASALADFDFSGARERLLIAREALGLARA